MFCLVLFCFTTLVRVRKEVRTFQLPGSFTCISSGRGGGRGGLRSPWTYRLALTRRRTGQGTFQYPPFTDP